VAANAPSQTLTMELEQASKIELTSEPMAGDLKTQASRFVNPSNQQPRPTVANIRADTLKGVAMTESA
jgi:hypothetical protein